MCWKCGKALSVPAPVSRTEACGVCGADVRCCKNCAQYLPGAHYHCHETVDEPVHDKERSNFCDSFVLNPSAGTAKGKSPELDKAQQARDTLAKLFG